MPLASGVAAAQEVPSSPPAHRQTDSSLYYTASWGSPYQRPPPSSTPTSQSRYFHERTFSSDDFGDDLPVHNLRFESLLPPITSADCSEGRVQSSTFTSEILPRSSSSRVASQLRAEPIQGNNKEWVREYLTGHFDSERGNWWSDDSAESAPKILSSRGNLSWSTEAGEDHWSQASGNLYEDKIEDFGLEIGKSLESGRGSGRTVSGKGVRRHKSRKSNETLKPRDFLNLLQSPKDDHPLIGTMQASIYANSSSPAAQVAGGHSVSGSSGAAQRNPPPAMDKPLPPPPHLRTVSDFPTREVSDQITTMASATPPTSSPVSSPIKPKKKTTVKGKGTCAGKNIAVSLPFDEGRRLKPLQVSEVGAKMERWNAQGFNTQGFDHQDAVKKQVTSDDLVQSKDIWPDPVELTSEGKERQYRVSIPDRREWEAYVNYLNEEKLRALGVSFGDDDTAPAMSPAASSMGRQPSSQYPHLPFSPPLPTSSAASNSASHHANTFSPAFIPGTSTGTSSQVGSVASPVPSHKHMPSGFHVSRQSMSFPGREQQIGSPFQMATHQATPPIQAIWSPHQFINSHGLARGGSPAVLGNLQNMGAILSPGSPFDNQQQNDLMAQMRLQQQAIQAQLHHQPNQQQQQQQPLNLLNTSQSPRLENVREAEDEEQYQTQEEARLQTKHSNAEIATPVPRGHRHNVSESLQKEIDEAEYHLEESIPRQLDGEENEALSDSAAAWRFPSIGDARPGAPGGITPIDTQENFSVATKGTQGSQVEISGSRLADEPSPQNNKIMTPESSPSIRELTLPQESSGDQIDPSSSQEVEDRIREEIHDDISEGGKTNISEVDTNPSFSASPERRLYTSTQGHGHTLSNMSNPWQDTKSRAFEPPVLNPSRPSHHSTSSVSKLNVEAKEFSFEPTKSFIPGNFSFSGNQFQPAKSVQPIVETANHSTHPSNISIGSLGSLNSSKLNVAAPAFNPSSSTRSMPSGNFDFSAAAPSFRPDAPAFTPGNLAFKPAVSDAIASEKSGSVGPSSTEEKIFTFTDAVPPAKKSKAIPIIRPDEGSDPVKDVEDVYDFEGRLARAGNQKRARRNDVDADDVPQFAVPTHPLTETGQASSPPKDLPKGLDTEFGGKENSIPQDEERDVVPESVRVKPPIGPRPRSFLDESPDYDGRGYAPWEFAKQEEAAKFSGTSPTSQPPMKSPQLKVYKGNEDSDEDMRELSVQQAELAAAAADLASMTKGKSNIPTPAVKPFNAQPAADFDSILGAKKPQAREPPRKLGGLEASRFATSHTPPEVIKDPLVAESHPSRLVSPELSPPASQKATSRESSGDVSVDQHPLDDVDAVMKHLNGSDSDFGIERTGPAWTREAARQNEHKLSYPTPAQTLRPEQRIRSDAPSPSPQRFQQQYHALPQDVQSQSISLDSDPFTFGKPGKAYDSPVHRLNTPGDLPASDWDDAYSPAEDAKLHSRSLYFDNRVNDVVGGILQQRLGPLEKSLSIIQESLALMTGHRASARSVEQTTSADRKDSDADDEDDNINESFQQRSWSPRKDKKFEKIKAVVLEAVSTLQPGPQHNVGEIRSVMEDILSKQVAFTKISPHVSLEELQLKTSTLERLHKDAELRAEQEVQNCRKAEGKVLELEQALRLSRLEETKQRELVEEKDRKLRAIDDKRHQSMVQVQMRTALLEGAQENSQKTVSDLSAKNAALEGSLREARLAGDKSKAELETVDAENKELRKMMDSLKTRLEESIRIRDGLDEKFDKLQEGMVSAEHEFAQEREQWRKQDQQHASRQEIMGARLEAEARTRERLEREIERLENQEREAMKSRFQVEQVQKANNHLETIVNNLREESISNQSAAAKFEREFNEAREAGRYEVQRTRVLMQADIEAANNQVNIIRAEMDSQLDRARAETEHFRMEAETSRENLELLRDASEAAKAKAIADTRESGDVAMKEQHRKYELHLESIKSQHDRALRNALEDKQRLEQHLMERLSLSDAKTDHLNDKVAHLEEKLEVSNCAARAAAQAAQKVSAISSPASSRVGGSAPVPQEMELPEKISPQALRESILVLQEQLQEREGRIEKLEQELAGVDRDAPKKVQEREIEVGWLRELLGVRIADLEDIVKHLSEAAYDREAVKDAAIRLKTNLQMEQQERERAMAGGQTFPSLASISNFASPKAAAAVLPLAAAWGNWRRGRESSVGNLSEIAASNGARSSSETPSKAPPTPSFLSGLLTPPSTNLRQTPEPRGRPIDARRSLSNVSDHGSSISQQGVSRRRDKVPKRMEQAPSTPPLMRTADYDSDAASAKGFGGKELEDDDIDYSSLIGRRDPTRGETGEEPFGPTIKPAPTL